MSDFMTGFLDKQLTQLDEHIASLQRELEEAQLEEKRAKFREDEMFKCAYTWQKRLRKIREAVSAAPTAQLAVQAIDRIASEPVGKPAACSECARLRELIGKLARLAVQNCGCSLRERDSGHRVDCWTIQEDTMDLAALATPAAKAGETEETR